MVKNLINFFTFFFFCLIDNEFKNIGLRGAMAFALALQSVHDLPEGHGQTIFTATTAIVVLTVGKVTFFSVIRDFIWLNMILF